MVETDSGSSASLPVGESGLLLRLWNWGSTEDWDVPDALGDAVFVDDPRWGGPDPWLWQASRRREGVL